MSADPSEELGALLKDVRSGGSFATRRTAPTGDLVLGVAGVGPMALPVSAAQAKQLRLVARPALYGHGERTILDTGVRDTWEIPRARVKIDTRRWHRTLRPMLDALRDDLGLAATARLTAELHSMLLYEPGQFFAPHQDSEKRDEMIGSLIVMLPGVSKGGALVVEHRGTSSRFEGSRTALTFVAFYSDTRHEVLPVESGRRVVLTYNLMLAGKGGSGNNKDATHAVASMLKQHFSSVPAARRRGDHLATTPPDRLVFLLDHSYSERSLRWSSLKGDDAARAAVLASGAEACGCVLTLAHAEVHETWDCYDDDERRSRGRHRSDWDDDENDDENDDGGPPKGDDDFELGELLDSTVSIRAATGSGVVLHPTVTSVELAESTSSDQLKPYDTEYTGYMGNWGNTMDRWYHRAAIVIWPHARSFAVRAKGDPLGAIEQLLATLKHEGAGDSDADVSVLLRFWRDAVRSGDQRPLMPLALQLAAILGEHAQAAMLLEPFSLQALTPNDASVLVQLTQRHGVAWIDTQIGQLLKDRGSQTPVGLPAFEDWVAQTLERLCADLCDGRLHADGGPLGRRVAGSVVRSVWKRLHEVVITSAVIDSPSARIISLRELGESMLAVLRCADVAGETDPRRMFASLVTEGPNLIPLVVRMVEVAQALPSATLHQIGIADLARHCADTLAADLDRPERAPDDWSITQLDAGTCCADCDNLVDFLRDATRREMTWPLAKPRRQHVHHRIDRAELPVTHRTLRQGSPQKLILAKTADVHGRDAQRRRAIRHDLDVVRKLLVSVDQSDVGSSVPATRRARRASS